MRILVTGGAGFIGSKFCIQAIRDGHEVTILDALTYAGLIDNIDARANFIYGNVCDVALVDELVSRADWIVHFAAETHVARSIVNNRVFFETDVIGTQTIAQAVVKHRATVERFLHFSTSEVYGTARNDLIKMDEDHPLNPMSPYAAAKAGADRLVYSYVKTYGIPAVIARCFNVYGPRQHPEKLIPRFITSALLGRALTIHGEGAAVRDFVHVEDVRNAVLLLLERGEVGEVYNIGSGKGRSVQEVAWAVQKVFDPQPVALVHCADRPGQVDRHVCDWGKICALGWEPKADWELSLQAIATWYRENRQWMRQLPLAITEVPEQAGVAA